MLIDSNMPCFYFDQSCKEHKKAVASLEHAMAKKQPLLSNTVVIMEVSHFLVKNLGPRIGKEKADIFIGFP